MGAIVSAIVGCAFAIAAMALGRNVFRRAWQASATGGGQPELRHAAVALGLLLAGAAFAPWSWWARFGESGLTDAVATLTVVRVILLTVGLPYAVGAIWASAVTMEIRAWRTTRRPVAVGGDDER